MIFDWEPNKKRPRSMMYLYLKDTTILLYKSISKKWFWRREEDPYTVCNLSTPYDSKEECEKDIIRSFGGMTAITSKLRTKRSAAKKEIIII